MASNYCESCGMRDTELSHHDQCPVGEAQARAKEQVLALASAMEACSECRGQRTVGASPEEAEYCGNCGGSGSVPRFKELRVRCRCYCHVATRGCFGGGACIGCGNRHWLPLPVAEAAGKIRQMKGFQEWLIYGRDWIGLEKFVLMICDDHAVIAAAAAWAESCP